MELSVESLCQYVTWKVRDFFELPSEIGYSLDSPEIRFAGDSYCLRLYSKGSDDDEDDETTEIQLVRLTSTFPERSVSCKVGYRWREKEREVDSYSSALDNKLLLNRIILEKYRGDDDGIFTVLCFMRLKEPSSAEIPQSEEDKTSDTKEKQEGLPGQSVFSSSRSWSFKMELSVESPCQNVTWKIPDFFHLLSKTGYSLNSPEFCFAGSRYCLQFYPKGTNSGNTVDTDLQLVKLTSTFPERIVLYKVGYKWIYNEGDDRETYHHSGVLIGDCGLCLSRSHLEEYKDIYFPDGTLNLVCSMRLKEQNSAGSPQSEEAGNSQTEEKLEGLRETPNSVSCAVQTEVSDGVVASDNQDWSSLDTKGMSKLHTDYKWYLRVA